MNTVRTVIAALLLCVSPLPAFAAALTFETPTGTVRAGDTVVVRMYLDSGAVSLNALDATLTLRDSTAQVAIQEVGRSGSVLSIWPGDPILTGDKKEVQFTAGEPEGIPTSRALLANLVLTVLSSGTVTVRTSAAQAYADDGKGTIVPVVSNPRTFGVSEAQSGVPVRNDWSALVSTDTTPPEPFSVTVGHDPSVFDGKQFIAFQTTDTQSGIDRYEVQEGTAAPVVSDITYVLKHQSTSETVTVFAYDKAGNVQRAILTTAGTPGTRSIAWGIGSVFLLLLLVLWIVRSRNKTHV